MKEKPAGAHEAGIFISLEGLDFSGKSEQCQRLAACLRAAGYANVEPLREPGGVQIAEAIRHILLDHRNVEMNARTELFLYSAARAQITSERILPALQAGKIIVADRISRAIVTLLLAVSLGNIFATPSLALFVDQFDPASRTHVALAAVNLFNIWFVGTMAVALSKLASVAFAKAASVIFGFWVLIDIILISIGAGQFVM
jgi:hypothetical protein